MQGITSQLVVLTRFQSPPEEEREADREKVPATGGEKEGGLPNVLARPSCAIGTRDEKDWWQEINMNHQNMSGG